jgi:hypothetical protein
MKETLKRLNRYLTYLNDRASSGIPEKHKNRVASYKRFLDNEIAAVKAKIEALKLGDQGK